MVSSEMKETEVSPSVSKVSMLISALLMGNVGLFVTFLSHYAVFTIVLFRGIFGTLFLTLFMLKSHSLNRPFLKESFKWHWKPLIIVGIMNPVVIYFYFLNITISGYAVAAFLLYTSGIFVLLFLIIAKEEPVSKITLFSFILAIIGVGIIMELWTGDGLTSGILFGLLSGITLAIMTISKKKIYKFREENPSEFRAQGDFNMFLAWWSTLFIIIVLLPVGILDLAKLTLVDLVFCILLGFFPSALAFTLFNIGIKNDKGGNILILAYFEPVMATINTVIFLGYLSVFTILGGSLILVANIIVLQYSK